MPDADQEGSLIVSVTDVGSVYLGVVPISPAALAEDVKAGLSKRPERKLYIKADARTPDANVMEGLDALHTGGVGALNLLTAQPDSSEPGTVVPPKGLEVLVDPVLPSGSEEIVVQLLKSGQRSPTLKINNALVPWATAQTTLKQMFEKGSAKVVLVKAEGILPFADVVNVTDLCRSTGATVVLATLGL
jgi:biopolymer transport protein ExbD